MPHKIPALAHDQESTGSDAMKDGYSDRVKLSQIRALVAVADWNNFTEAALQLNVSQSAVSHAIASLEEELGVLLVARGRYGANLTPIGEQILIDARQIMRSLDDIGRKAAIAKGLHGGQVRIAAFRSVSTHILPAVIAQFRQMFPGISVAFTEHHNLEAVGQQLRQGLADIGFTYLPTADEFESWELFRDEYVVLLPADTRISGDRLTWEELKQYPLILPPADDSCRPLLRQHFNELNQTLNVAYEVREDSTIVSMVAQGLGAAILARLAAEPIPHSVKVYHLPIPLERIIGVIVLAAAMHPPSVYAFLDALRGTGQFSSTPLLQKV